MVDTTSTDTELEQLQAVKTGLLRELRSNMQSEKEAVWAENIELLQKLITRASELMGKIDAADARLRELVSPISEEVRSLPLTDEQKYLLLGIKQLHQEITGELIKQKTAVVEQMKELRQVNSAVGMYKKNRLLEGVFVDQKK